MARTIFGELIDRRVAASRLLAQRLDDDGVQITGQAAAQPIGIPDGRPRRAWSISET